MYENILIPTDGSDSAQEAVDHGIELAKTVDAKVHSLYVVETEATYFITADLDDEEMDEYKEYGEELVTAVTNEASAEGVDAQGAVKVGKIAQEIVEYAEDHDIDLIVMGRRGRGSIEQYLGSIAEKVVRMSEIPVTVVGTESPG